MKSDHIHTPEDGRGYARAVFVNGSEVEGCFFADTKRGIARVYRSPLKTDKRLKRFLTKTLRGTVEVRPK